MVGRLTQASRIRVRLPVWEDQTATERTEVVGALVVPPRWESGVLQLLVAGGTYNRSYWDIPGPDDDPSRNSYVARAFGAGHATLALDLIGRGESGHPPSDRVNLTNDAWTVHQVAELARQGHCGLEKPEAIVAVGHSLGTVALWEALSKWQSLDGAILSGSSHHPISDVHAGAGFCSASAVARWSHLDSGYLTTAPEARGMFYEPGEWDSNVLAWDEQNKDLMTTSHFRGLRAAFTTPADVRVPTLLVIGAADPFHSAIIRTSERALKEGEGPWLGRNVPSIDGYVLGRSGHSLNAMRDAGYWFDVAQEWVGKRFGRG